MRLKTFHAPSLSAAMEMVRQQLGADAIIVATNEDEGGRGARVTAAIETAEDEEFGFEDEVDVVDAVSDVLDRHGAPAHLNEAVSNAVAELSVPEPSLALTAALDTVFRFAPLPQKRSDKPVMLIGPPGVGKTSGIAKLAARSIVEHGTATLITIDTVRAGAVEQLRAYGERLSSEVSVATEPAQLEKAIGKRRNRGLVLIDTPSINPYDRADMELIRRFIRVAEIEPVLVMSAGRNARDATELSVAFADLQPRRLIVTCLDIAHRLGDILAAADAADLAFAEFSPTPAIGNGIRPLNPGSLARLLLPESRMDGWASSRKPAAMLPASKASKAKRP